MKAVNSSSLGKMALAVFVLEKREKVFQRGKDMDKYNAEHYSDRTAAIAIARVDRAKCVPKMTWTGLTYRIGEVYRLTYKNGMVTLWE